MYAVNYDLTSVFAEVICGAFVNRGIKLCEMLANTEYASTIIEQSSNLLESHILCNSNNNMAAPMIRHEGVL